MRKKKNLLILKLCIKVSLILLKFKMEDKIQSRIIKKFGPSILQVKIPEKIIKNRRNPAEKEW